MAPEMRETVVDITSVWSGS